MRNIQYKYGNEYLNSKENFWALKPAKFVLKLSDYLDGNFQGKSILDLGAGEGKNAVYLAHLGGLVTAVDVSSTALGRFRSQPNYEQSKSRLEIINEDICDLSFENETFDIVIAYGILHCLSSKLEISETIERIKGWIKSGGYFVCVTFTNKIPPPVIQDYLEFEAFIGEGEIKLMFDGWSVINYEEDIITETHPTSNIEHQHSLTRIIVQKNV